MKNIHWYLVIFVALGMETLAQENELAPATTPPKPVESLAGGTTDQAIYLMEFRVLGFRSDDETFEFPGGDSEQGGLTELEFDQLVSQEGVTIVSAPKVTTLGGRQAQVFVSQVAPQYFEPSGEGYVLKTLAPEDAPGLMVDVIIQELAGDRDSSARLDLGVRMTIVKDRMELPGVQLDVGQPILESRTVEASLDLSLGRWVYLKSSEFETVNSSNINAFIVLAKAHRVDGRGNVLRPVERNLIESLELKAETIEKSADGRLIRGRGDVSFRLPRESFGNARNELESFGMIGRASQVEIRQLDESREPGFRADRIDSDAELGGMALEGDVVIEFDRVSIRSDRVSLIHEQTIHVRIDPLGEIDLNGAPLKLEELERALQKIGADKTSPVVVQAHQRVDWDVVSEVVQTVKRVGVVRLSVKAIGIE